MPKRGKDQRKAAAEPLAVPSLDNRPRYRTPKVQGNAPHLPTLEPTPAVRTGNRGLSEEAVVSVSDPVKRVITDILSLVDRIQAREFTSLHRYSGEEEYEASARGEISEEDHIESGPWVSKGNPTGYLDSDGELIVDQMGHE